MKRIIAAAAAVLFSCNVYAADLSGLSQEEATAQRNNFAICSGISSAGEDMLKRVVAAAMDHRLFSENIETAMVYADTEMHAIGSGMVVDALNEYLNEHYQADSKTLKEASDKLIAMGRARSAAKYRAAGPDLVDSVMEDQRLCSEKLKGFAEYLMKQKS